MLRHELADSAAPSPIDTITPPEQESRKRKGTYPARGVASLTAEQLAKKRANDREAQRAIRERTKTQIETLERRIQDLTSQQPYQELQSVLRQKDAVQTENDEIRRRLASVLSIIQPIVGAQCLTDLAIAAHGDLQNGQSPQQSASFDRNIYMNGHNGHVLQPLAPSSPTLVTTPKPTSYPQSYSNSAVGTSQNERQWPPYDAYSQQRNNLQHGLELNESGEKLGFSFLLDNALRDDGKTKAAQPLRDHQSSSEDPCPSFQKTQYDSSTPFWATPCLNIPATCPFDGILLDFVSSRQREAAEGVPRSRLVGPAYPSVSSLLNSDESRCSHPLSQVIIDILSNFPYISAIPEQVAVLYIMFLVVRWQIHPSQDNYERLPSWMTPRPSQLFTPHPAWIDLLPWPKMRDKLVSSYSDYAFEDWFISYTSTLSLNWPYEPTDCLLSTSANEEMAINPVFERHMMKLENWSLGTAFAQAHPAMAGTARIKNESKRSMADAMADNEFG